MNVPEHSQVTDPDAARMVLRANGYEVKLAVVFGAPAWQLLKGGHVRTTLESHSGLVTAACMVEAGYKL